MGNSTRPIGYCHWTRIEDGTSQRCSTYATTQTASDVLAWIGSVPEPWLCDVAFNAVHAPFHEPPASLHSFDFGQGSRPRLRYKAMVEALDAEIGRLLPGIQGQRDRTTAFFLGDNGTPGDVLPPSAPPWQCRLHLFEGGVHVPFIVSGPDVQMPGSECEAFVSLVDVFATVADLARVKLGSVLPPSPSVDGISLVPCLRNPGAESARKGNHSGMSGPAGTGPYTLQAAGISDGGYNLLLAPPLSPEQQARFEKLKRWMARVRG